MFGALEIPLVCAGPQHINVHACLFSSLAFYAISRKDVSHHLRSTCSTCLHRTHQCHKHSQVILLLISQCIADHTLTPNSPEIVKQSKENNV